MKASYRSLIVWHKSLVFAKQVYRVTALLPPEELYGLASQMRRAAISIPSNIAEGQQRKSRKEFLQFLRIALGSSAELHTQIMLCHDLYPQTGANVLDTDIEEVRKMLSGMIRKLETVNS